MKFNVKMSYYCTVTEEVMVEADSEEEAIKLVEQGNFKQYKEPRSDVVIDWDSISTEEIKVMEVE